MHPDQEETQLSLGNPRGSLQVERRVLDYLLRMGKAQRAD